MRGIMTARAKPLKVMEPVEAELNTAEVLSFENLPDKGAVKLIEPDNAEELIELLKNEAKVL